MKDKGGITIDGYVWYSMYQMKTIFGKTPETIRNWTKRGKIIKINRGGLKLYRLADGVSIISAQKADNL
jgi:hypothetical protein